MLLNNFKKLNNTIGWLVFAIAAYTYLATIEPTASFWDCGEYILSCYKLEVGHPPGAPVFLILGRFFITLLGGSDVKSVAYAINVMNALASAFTILFLFWSITMLARKIFENNNEAIGGGKKWAVLGSGIVGALAYTFSDSFWFSAVEGEVYAMASLCTAMVFWAILKWERVAHEPFADRWIVFIWFIVGLSIGVHLLNLLCIPAIVVVYYFKKYKVTQKGIIIATLIGVVLLALVLNGIIPWIVELSAKFELIFVNGFGAPFNSGTIFYFVLLIGGLLLGLRYSIQNKKYMLNTALVSFATVLIGYSSFFILVIRSQANTPMDQNNPENAINLLSYLKREQYGDWPLMYGQYYNSPLNKEEPYGDGTPVYKRDDEKGEYVIADERKNEKPNYDPEFCTVLPRMWSQQGNHERAYKAWATIKGNRIKYDNPFTGKTEVIEKPTFWENMSFMFKYQIGHMYLRYFMWNFVGRQNDIQGHGIEKTSGIEGNWISGVNFIDEMRLGSQAKLPESVTTNKGNNKFYFLPLILGIIGLLYHTLRNGNDAYVVGLLFLLTGMAIVLYLNQYPYQPRERDYAFAGSFYAFAIWIGLGVIAIFDFLKQVKNETMRAALVTIACTLAVPTLMAKDGWNDHNRSNRYTCVDYAANYLNSCQKNAIIFTNGDNDTFPLWYAQEVEGIRTDVRVVNLSLANTDWYIEQIRRRAYDSDPVKLTLTQDKYWQGHRDWVPIRDNKSAAFTDLKKVIEFCGDEKNKTSVGDDMMAYLPTKKFRVPVDSVKVIKNGTISIADTADLVKSMEWQINKSYLLKADLLVLDIIASNNWERPIYFSVTTGSDAYLSLQNYFQLEGLAYRLVPLKPNPSKPLRMRTDVMYENMMKKWAWGGLDKQEVYMDENNVRMAQTMRMQLITLANQLVEEGKKDKAKEVLQKQLLVLPEKNVPYCNEPYEYNIYLIEALYKCGDMENANKTAMRFMEIMDGDMKYYLSLDTKTRNTLMNEMYRKTDMMQRIIDQAKRAKQTDAVQKLENIFKQYENYLPADESKQGPINP
jgi:hypothetical protein